MKILVVDDSSTTRRLITGLLFNIGFSDVHQAADGRQGLAKLKSASNFDLLVTDWNMPEMNGLELVKAVRSDPELKDIRILMVTAEATRDAVMAAAKAGINGYITKPFNAATLKDKIGKIFPNSDIKEEGSSLKVGLNSDLLRLIKP